MITYDPLRCRLTIDDIDLAEASKPMQSETFWKLSRDERWDIMGDGNDTYTIGGRSVDVSQLAMSVESIVEGFYGDQMPEDVRERLVAFRGVANCAEHLIGRLIEDMSLVAKAKRWLDDPQL